MSLRVIGGRAKGFKMELPSSHTTRPTSVLLKRKIFDSFTIELSDCTLVDLCAGSGAFGIEALSRGFESALFIENDLACYQILSSNLKKFDDKYPHHKYESKKISALKWLEQFRLNYNKLSHSQKERYILFFDPPYEMDELYQAFLKILLEENWFFGHVWIESDLKKTPALSEFEKLEKFRIDGRRNQFIHSDSCINCYKFS